jgi:hypothetical protein
MEKDIECRVSIDLYRQRRVANLFTLWFRREARHRAQARRRRFLFRKGKCHRLLDGDFNLGARLWLHRGGFPSL